MSITGDIAGDIAGSIGAYQGAGQMKKGYKRAHNILQQLRQTAEHAQDSADPFRTYRPEIARYLSDLVMGRADISTDPGYEFARDEAMRGTRRQMAAQGMGESGNVLAALQQRASGLAAQQYGSIIDRLMNLSAATPGNATAGAQLYGNLESQRIGGQAQAAIGRSVASAQQRGALWSGIGSAGTALFGSMNPAQAAAAAGSGGGSLAGFTGGSRAGSFTGQLPPLNF